MLSPRFGGAYVKSLWILVLAGTMTLAACGSGSSSSNSQIPLTLEGNWQFNMAEQINPDLSQPSFTGGLQGGFLLQNNGAVAGQVTFSITAMPPAGSGGTPTQCNSGTDQITGTINGQAVTLTASSAGGQTFNLTGTLSLDNSTMTGSYTSTDGAGCGIAVTQTWSAFLVPPLTGPIQGSFHSTGGAAGLAEQEFLVSGALSQAANTGAASATVTGDLSFINSLTSLSDYPCFTSASVNGQISGNTVTLQIIGTGQSELGLIGVTAGSNGAATNLSPVTFTSAYGGHILSGSGGLSYLVATSLCPQTNSGNAPLTVSDAGDYGNICLAVNNTTACQQQITLTPSALIFPFESAGSPPIMQTVTLANNSGAALGGLTLALANNNNGGVFSEIDACGPNAGSEPFSLLPGQSCVITVTFTPVCTTQCGLPLTATLTVNSPTNDAIFNLPITGGVNAASASIRELVFSAEGISAASLLPLLSLIDPSVHPVQPLPNASARPFQDEQHHAEVD